MAQQGASDSRVQLGDSVEIFADRPRPELASPGTQVFEAKDRRIAGDHMAMLCGWESVPRISVLGAYKNLKTGTALRLHEAGIVRWHDGREYFALIFDRLPARRMMASMDDRPKAFNEDRLFSVLIKPGIEALASLRNVDFIHGAINPMNLFLSGAEGAETLTIGECLSTQPSWGQEPLFETIDRAMAQPAGRGIGTGKDDLYAFGMCVALAARGENFAAGMSPSQILRAKMEEGSYAFAVGGTRLPAGVLEFLRGVLSDDEELRWSSDEATAWIETHHIAPKKPRSKVRAARPFPFKDWKYWDLRSLSQAFARDMAEGMKTVEQDQFDLWLKRNFEDKALFKRLEDVWEREKGAGRDKLMSGVCMVLDPSAPLRYKSVQAFPGGFGGVIAETFAKGQDLQVVGEILTQQMFSMWINMRFEEISDAAGLLSQFEKCRNYLTQKMAGYGMERVLYTLNRDCACMSPALKDYFVVNPARLVHALEDLARKGVRPEHVLDRHMVAFLSVRDPKTIDPWLGNVVSRDRASQVVGYIRTLATIQRKSAIQSLPSLCAWMGTLGQAALDRFSDADLRQELARRMERAQAGGDLMALLELVDSGAILSEDSARFEQAQREYGALAREKALIGRAVGKRRGFGQASGRQAAMLVSAAFASLSVLGYIVFFFMKRFL